MSIIIVSCCMSSIVATLWYYRITKNFNLLDVTVSWFSGFLCQLVFGLINYQIFLNRDNLGYLFLFSLLVGALSGLSVDNFHKLTEVLSKKF